MNRRTPNNTGKGQTYSGNYTPAPLVPGVSETVRDRLLDEMRSLMQKIEGHGEELLEFGSPLWYLGAFHL